jgi:hypothetical protein
MQLVKSAKRTDWYARGIGRVSRSRLSLVQKSLYLSVLDPYRNVLL